MFMNMKRAKYIAWGMAICFLLIHILMLNIFTQCNVAPMVKVNVFSIVFYVLMIYVVHKEWLPFYTVAVYLEVAVHMSLAVLFTGWNSGFQITLIGMNVLAFYAEYTGRALKLKYIRVMPLGILGMILYLGTYVYIHFHPAKYLLSEKAEFWLSLLWGVIVFVINLFVLQLLVFIANSSEEQLEFQLYHDKLTGLPNRYFLAEMMKGLENATDEDYWVAIADIDDFKKVNDTYGHNAGDYVLRVVGEILSKKEAICIRWGGEEFLFFEKSKRTREDILKLLDDARKEIASYPFEYGGNSFNITITFGMNKFSPRKTMEDVFREADDRLYEGKRQGKNQVVG